MESAEYVAIIASRSSMAYKYGISMGNGIGAFLISLAVGGAAAAVCGIIIGIPALRLRGDYLAIVTLAFGEIVKSLFQNSSDDTFGGSLPAFLAAFSTRKKLTDQEIDEMKNLIENMRG